MAADAGQIATCRLTNRCSRPGAGSSVVDRWRSPSHNRARLTRRHEAGSWARASAGHHTVSRMRHGTLLSDAKGHFAETIVSTVLEYAGYRVVRLGVEEMVSEVKAAVARAERSLKLPEQLRSAPDFLVVDPRSGESPLLEVKFRRALDDPAAEAPHQRLARQVAFWPGMVTPIVCADRPNSPAARAPISVRTSAAFARATSIGSCNRTPTCRASNAFGRSARSLRRSPGSTCTKSPSNSYRRFVLGRSEFVAGWRTNRCS